MARKLNKAKRIKTQPKRQEKAPFLAHIQEFRRRLVWVAIVVVSFAAVGYAIRNQLIDFLLNPAKDQKFIYTTPGGGLNFILQISVYFGVVIGIPIIIYHVLRYLEPLLNKNERGFIFKCALLSAALAISGMAFGYFVGLPAALIFLSNQFENQQITALLTLNDYLSFVTVYMLGSALMFQIPVILVFANRVKPLSAKKLAMSQRWVIIIAFVAAAVITPTPDMFNQCIIAIPIILVYQIGVMLVASQNRYSATLKANRLRGQDKTLWDKRQQTATKAQPLHEALLPEPIALKAEQKKPIPQPAPVKAAVKPIKPVKKPSVRSLEPSRIIKRTVSVSTKDEDPIELSPTPKKVFVKEAAPTTPEPKPAGPRRIAIFDAD